MTNPHAYRYPKAPRQLRNQDRFEALLDGFVARLECKCGQRAVLLQTKCVDCIDRHARVRKITRRRAALTRECVVE